VSLKPVLPQFAAACLEFARATGFPRPFAALDWCLTCGEPDWAHQAGAPDRLLRLAGLDPDDMSYALAYLAEYSPAAFDTILDVLGPADPATQDNANEVLYCTTCGARSGSSWSTAPTTAITATARMATTSATASTTRPSSVGDRQHDPSKATKSAHGACPSIAPTSVRLIRKCVDMGCRHAA
jgi:hypothetical protein